MLRRIRIPVQLFCLLLFLYLLVRTLGRGENQLGPPVRVFLEIDPLVGLTTWLRTGAWHGGLALSLVTVVLTLLLGRFFCGWICPLGTLSQISGRLWPGRDRERDADHWRPWQRWKVLLLVFVLGGALAGSLWTGLLDPLCLLIRSLAVGLAPGVELLVRGAAKGLASTPLAPWSEPAYQWVRDHALAPHAPRYEQSFLLAAILCALLGLSWIRRRFWCRVLCPLGGLLGVIAQAGSLQLRQKSEACSGCALCAYHCQGAADPDRMGGWRASECFVCGNCTSACHRGGLAFGFVPPRIAAATVAVRGSWRGFAARMRSRDRRRTPRAPAGASFALERRRFLLGLSLGLISGPLGRVSPARAHPERTCIRPPGAGSEEEFLARCIRCGECMKVCPANGLHPAGLEEGPLGLWTPVLRPRLGYCEYECTLCGQVCPTGAIARLTAEQKAQTVLGLAYVDPGLCLPYAFATPCIVCEEQCPTSPKAIWLEEVTAAAADGSSRALRRPHVDPARCVGCGICEYRCPMQGLAAIRITATGRTGAGGPFQEVGSESG